jgi:hypothetical protein
MSTRWLAGALLFTLGFGSAELAKLPKSGAASREGVVEGSLRYIDGEDFRLVYPPGGKAEYLVVVTRKPGTVKESAARVSTQIGVAVFSKKDLEKLTVYRVTGLLTWKGGVDRCGHGIDYCPLPPPPPPLEVISLFFKSGPVKAGSPH